MELNKLTQPLMNFIIQSSFTVKNPHVRLVEIGHMTTLCVSIPQSMSAVIKSYNALLLLQLSIHSETVQIFVQVLVMNSVFFSFKNGFETTFQERKSR